MAYTASITTALLALATGESAQDPVHSDGDKYGAILENPCVRVLEYRDQPGDRTRLHADPRHHRRAQA